MALVPWLKCAQACLFSFQIVRFELLHSLSPFFHEHIVNLPQVSLGGSEPILVSLVSAGKLVEIERRSHLRQRQRQLCLVFQAIPCQDILGVHLVQKGIVLLFSLFVSWNGLVPGVFYWYYVGVLWALLGGQSLLGFFVRAKVDSVPHLLVLLHVSNFVPGVWEQSELVDVIVGVRPGVKRELGLVPNFSCVHLHQEIILSLKSIPIEHVSCRKVYELIQYFLLC